MQMNCLIQNLLQGEVRKTDSKQIARAYEEFASEQYLKIRSGCRCYGELKGKMEEGSVAKPRSCQYCRNYIQHYMKAQTARGAEYRPINAGHCVNGVPACRGGKKRPAPGDTCQYFELGTPHIGEGARMRKNLKEARQRAGLTQKAVAEYLKVSERHYKFMESGQTTGNVELWDRLEDLFNVHQRVLRENRPDKEGNQ